MNFKEEINELELLDFTNDFIIKKGNLPILFTAPHTMKQIREDGSIKLNEPYTKAIALYLNKHFNVNCMIKINDTGLDVNRDNRDEFKTELLRFIKDNNIKLVIDLHGSNKSRDFDIEFGTLNNLSADFSTIKELEEAFTENKISNIIHNDPFKGGSITNLILLSLINLSNSILNSSLLSLLASNPVSFILIIQLTLKCLFKYKAIAFVYGSLNFSLPSSLICFIV